MPQRNVATNFTFEQQRTEINSIAEDYWIFQGNQTTANGTFLKADGTVATTAALTLGGHLNVPNAFTINSNSGNGTVTINGNLQVDGTTTTVNTATMDVVDKNITIAKGSANDAAADGAGITIDSGANDITFNFVDAKDALVSSIGLEATTTLVAGGLASLKGAQFAGTQTAATGVGVEITQVDANTGNIQAYDRTNSAFKDLRVKGASVGFYAGSTNALVGAFHNTGLTMESGKTITGVLATAAQTNITSLGTLTGLDLGDNNITNVGEISLDKIKPDNANVMINMGTDKNVSFSGGIGEIDNVTGFQTSNDAGSANTAFGIRANDIRLATGSAERVRITDTGVGIGTENPGQLLEINGGSSPCVLVKDTTNDVISYLFADDSNAYVGAASNHPVIIKQNNGTAVTIDTNKDATFVGIVDAPRVDCNGLLHIQYGNATNTNYMSSFSNNNGIMHLFRGDGLYIGDNMNTSNQAGGPNNKAITLGTNGTITASSTLTIGAVNGTNTNSYLPVLFQTAAGVIEGGSGLTYNPGGDTLQVNGLTISQGGINGNASSLNLSCANHSSTCNIVIGSIVNIKNQATFSNNAASSKTAARFENFENSAAGDCRVQIATYANAGADPFIHFDAGGSNMIVGNWYNGTTNNKLILGAGDSPSGTVKGFTIDGNGMVAPTSDNAYDLGSSGNRWRNVYTADLQMNNTGTGGNEVDGSEGRWTMQEGSDDLFLINRNTGKKYKFNLTEVS